MLLSEQEHVTAVPILDGVITGEFSGLYHLYPLSPGSDFEKILNSEIDRLQEKIDECSEKVDVIECRPTRSPYCRVCNRFRLWGENQRVFFCPIHEEPDPSVDVQEEYSVYKSKGWV